MTSVETTEVTVGAIKTLNDIVSPALTETIQKYADWYQMQSIVIVFTTLAFWIMAGILIKYFRKIQEKMFDNDLDTLFITMTVIGVIFLFLSPFILSAELPTIFYPEAYAIHALIKDVSGI